MSRHGRYSWLFAAVVVLMASYALRLLIDPAQAAVAEEAAPTSSRESRRQEASAPVRQETVRALPGGIVQQAPVEEAPASGPWRGMTVMAKYHPRPASEWQGMRVDVSTPALCQETSACGLAGACLQGHCSPCSSDSECGSGEACVLDHCVRQENVACRTRSDCRGAREVCALSGYSADPRGNATMRSYCLDEEGGQPQVRGPEQAQPQETQPQETQPATPRTTEQLLLQELSR
jgi:hypothetical protein